MEQHHLLPVSLRLEGGVCQRDQFADSEHGPLHAPMVRNGIQLMYKVGIPNFVSGPREYIMEGEYVILAMCSWFRIR